MPLYMDIHNRARAVTAAAIAEMHRKDLAIQEKHGVKFLKIWANTDPGHIFCLIEAPTPEAAFDVHREAHGNLASEIYEVFEQT